MISTKETENTISWKYPRNKFYTEPQKFVVNNVNERFTPEWVIMITPK
jgi:hypothetical protein